jgi:hypothetical protein
MKNTLYMCSATWNNREFHKLEFKEHVMNVEPVI